jgi:hypothetical protein
MFKQIILAFKFSFACRSALEKAIQLSIENAFNFLEADFKNSFCPNF